MKQGLQFETRNFLVTYLGLPLGLRKASAAQLQPLVDKAAAKLQPWCARLMNRGGRSTLVRTTLASMPVHAMMSLDLPYKTLDALQGIMRGFLWKGRRDVKGGHCLVAWDKVATPKEVGGLGVPNLRLMNLALRSRWPWLQRVDTSKLWSELNIQVLWQSRAIFEAATHTAIGDGETALFWTDRWLTGKRIVEIAPCLSAMVSKRTLATRTVREGLQGAWLRDCGPNLTREALDEFFLLWEQLREVHLDQSVADSHVWKWERDGHFSS